MVECIDPHSRASQANGRLHDFTNRHPSQATMRFENARYNPGNRDGAHADLKLLLSRTEISDDRVEIEFIIRASLFRRLAEKIVDAGFVPVGQRQQKPAAAKAGQQWLGNRCRAQCTQHRIERVAAGLQYFNGCLRNLRTTGSRHAQSLCQLFTL